MILLGMFRNLSLWPTHNDNTDGDIPEVGVTTPRGVEALHEEEHSRELLPESPTVHAVHVARLTAESPVNKSIALEQCLQLLRI